MEQPLDLQDMHTQDLPVNMLDSAELVPEINLYLDQELAPKIDSPDQAPRLALSRQ